LKIKNLKLKDNIQLLGYVFDGDEKYRTFSKSKIVVHPAFYDSGGMASAEAMAFGLPVIGFNLKAYESYYPKGMVKVKIGDVDDFAKAVLDLLDNDKKRNEVAQDALAMLNENWSWDKRAEEILEKLS
jgi:glycosyltransferase involved in cell wall biosynthesis